MDGEEGSKIARENRESRRVGFQGSGGRVVPVGVKSVFCFGKKLVKKGTKVAVCENALCFAK